MGNRPKKKLYGIVAVDAAMWADHLPKSMTSDELVLLYALAGRAGEDNKVFASVLGVGKKLKWSKAKVYRVFGRLRAYDLFVEIECRKNKPTVYLLNVPEVVRVEPDESLPGETPDCDESHPGETRDEVADCDESHPGGHESQNEAHESHSCEPRRTLSEGPSLKNPPSTEKGGEGVESVLARWAEAQRDVMRITPPKPSKADREAAAELWERRADADAIGRALEAALRDDGWKVKTLPTIAKCIDRFWQPDPYPARAERGFLPDDDRPPPPPPAWLPRSEPRAYGSPGEELADLKSRSFRSPFDLRRIAELEGSAQGSAPADDVPEKRAA